MKSECEWKIRKSGGSNDGRKWRKEFGDGEGGRCERSLRPKKDCASSVMSQRGCTWLFSLVDSNQQNNVRFYCILISDDVNYYISMN